ncbi:MAG: hypothetical protein CMJ83_14540 [Planctomycetes bacterium]|nr:hypothetical protein [Planctomycetota bacterium]
MEPKHTFWIFVVIVLVLAAGGVGFSYLASDQLVTAQRQAKEAHRKSMLTDRLLKDPMLAEWFSVRFKKKWHQAKNVDPTLEDEEEALRRFRERIKGLPDHIIAEMAK